MTTTAHVAQHVIHHGQSFRIHRPQACRIECIGGVVWLNQRGAVRDLRLVAGRSFQIESHRPLVVHALGVAEIRVIQEEPIREPAMPWWGIVGRLMGRDRRADALGLWVAQACGDAPSAAR